MDTVYLNINIETIIDPSNLQLQLYAKAMQFEQFIRNPEYRVRLFYKIE